MRSNSETNKRHEQRIKELDSWQLDIAYRNPIIRANSFDRLTLLYEDK